MKLKIKKYFVNGKFISTFYLLSMDYAYKGSKIFYLRQKQKLHQIRIVKTLFHPKEITFNGIFKIKPYILFMIN
jgi:hypothetical protein